MPNLPATLKMVSYSQRPTYIGLLWKPLPGVEVDRYEIFLSPKGLGNADAGAMVSGAKAGEGVIKVALPPSCISALDNKSPQGQRTYYTVLAVDKTGNYLQVDFQVNDAANMNLEGPTYLKEPYIPNSLVFTPYGQKPDGIAISWEAPKGDWASYRIVVLTGKSLSKPEDIEKIFTGALDFAKLYEVPADIREAIDDATPQGTRNYYSVVAVDKKGNLRALEKFQTAEAAQAKLKSPVRLSGKAPAAPSVTLPVQAPTAPIQGVGGPSAPAVPQVRAPAYPECGIKPQPPCDQPRLPPGVKYPTSLAMMPSTQHLYGMRIRIKTPRPDLSYRVVVASKSVTNPADALEGRLDYAKVYDLGPESNELIDNVTEPYTRCYYAVLGRDASGNHIELPFEVKAPSTYALGAAKFLDPGKKLALPTVDDDWLLKTTGKGIEVVPDPPNASQISSLGPFSTQVWEGTRFRIKGAKKDYLRYQVLISSNYIKKDGLVDAVRGRSEKIHAYEIPPDALELIDNITCTGSKVYIAVIGWDKEGNGYYVESEFPSTQYANFKAPRFVDPTDLVRVKTMADEAITIGRQLLSSIGTDKDSLFNKGPTIIQQALLVGQRARLVYPTYAEIDRYREELIDRNGWLGQAQAQFETLDAIARADTALKGDQQPYAFPNYSGAEEQIKTARQKQAESRALIQKLGTEAPWCARSPWHTERLKSFDENDAALKKLDDHMTELRARDAKAKALYDKAGEAHKASRFDEAIALYTEVTKVKPEWDTSADILRAQDDKEFASQATAAGTNLAKFKAMYEGWMKRDKSGYAWRSLRTAYERIGDKETFLFYERELFKHGFWSDVVDLWRETQSTKAGFLEGLFGADRVRDATIQMEEAEGELRRIDQSISDLQGKESELQREDSKLVGSGYSDYRTNLQNDIERVRNAAQRERERSEELRKRMATVLSGLFGQ